MFLILFKKYFLTSKTIKSKLVQINKRRTSVLCNELFHFTSNDKQVIEQFKYFIRKGKESVLLLFQFLINCFKLNYN